MNRAPVRYRVLILSVVAFSAPCLAAHAALPAGDAAALQTALAGRALAEGELVPRGFAQVGKAKAKGDLNGDGVDEVALIVRRAAKNKRKAAAAPPDEEAVPQAVLIFTGDKAGKYTLWKLGARHFMDGNGDLMEEGGVGMLEIAKGVLTIASDTAMSMGGWDAGGCTLKWRNEPAGFQLIGLTVTDVNRSCACGTTDDTNYLTGLSIFSSDRGEDGEQLPKMKVKRTKAKRPTILWEKFDFDRLCSS